MQAVITLPQNMPWQPMTKACHQCNHEGIIIILPHVSSYVTLVGMVRDSCTRNTRCIAHITNNEYTTVDWSQMTVGTVEVDCKHSF